MKITLLTLFPEMFESVLSGSILGRALEKELFSVELVDIRKYSDRKHKNADDYPFGGGAGMVMLAQPIVDAVEDATRDMPAHRVLLSPRGAPLTQGRVEALARLPHLLLLCGHYEGVDERVNDLCVDGEISIGDYILTGGELGAMVVVDAVARLLPGVLGSEDSAGEESFTSGLLEYPQYTRPRTYRGLDVPEVLLSGDHAAIGAYRLERSLRLTAERRPEMLRPWLLREGAKFSRRQRAGLRALFSELGREDLLSLLSQDNRRV